MAFLINIGFDNNLKFPKNIYYFEYKNIRYKLIQNNNKKWMDTLITIVPGFYNNIAIKNIYQNASEFLSAYCYDNDSIVTISYLGGIGVPDNFQLRSAKCTVFDFHKVPFTGRIQTNGIVRIPKIVTDDQRNAIVLYKLARSSNITFLSFLFYWQILEIHNNAINWINKANRLSYIKNSLINDDISNLKLKKSLGNYLYDDCRNALSHINNRKAGKTKIILDSHDDVIRLNISTRIIKEFAYIYIKNVLHLNSYSYLFQNKKYKFPIFLDY